jgi:uncharacterized protein (TIGR03435 family)
MRNNSHRLLAFGLSLCLLMAVYSLDFGAAPTQTASTAPPAFEVASVRLNQNPPTGAQVVSLRLSLSHGRLNFQAVSLMNLIQQAYDVQRVRVQGCPQWCNEDRFDVIAKAENPEATQAEVTMMLQTLLADRFKLALHRETKDLSGFALVIGKNGHKLQPAREDERVGAALDGYKRIYQKIGMAGLVNSLSQSAGAPVLDLTDLKGAFDFTIDLTPSETNPPLPRDGLPPDPTAAFERVRVAAETQLGLELRPRKIPTEMLIIDKVDHPTQN